jgi:uncharacterized linocin/CFP29 family protein
MTVDHLMRGKAPITAEAWEEIDSEARRSLTNYLAARKLIDFSGPHGWDFSAVASGRVGPAENLQGGSVRARPRLTRPVVEVRTPFTLQRDELDAITRGACDADLDPVIEAARKAAQAEDLMVFHGLGSAGVVGITDASPHDKVMISNDYAAYPGHAADAIAMMREAGVEGPWGIALGPRCYAGVMQQSEAGGYPVLKHLQLILEYGPVVFAPAIDGAVVVSQRGGDFELVCGQDFAVGYLDHDADSVQLYVEETIAARICSPEAAVHLAYPDNA